MLPKHYRNRYALIIILSLLIHALMISVLLWGIPDQEEKPKKKSVVVKLKHIDQTDKKAEPKKAEPKKAEPKKAEPKKAEPKKAEPKKAGPKKAEPKKAEPKKAESKQAGPKKSVPKSAAPEQAKQNKRKPREEDPNNVEFWMKKWGSMQSLDDKELKRAVVVTEGYGDKFKSRDAQASRLSRKLSKVQKQEFHAFYAYAVDFLTKTYVAPKNDGKKYYGEVAFLLDKDGWISNVTLKIPSGNKQLDLAFIKTLEEAERIDMPEDPVVAYFMQIRSHTLWFDESDME